MAVGAQEMRLQQSQQRAVTLAEIGSAGTEQDEDARQVARIEMVCQDALDPMRPIEIGIDTAAAPFSLAHEVVDRYRRPVGVAHHLANLRMLGNELLEYPFGIRNGRPVGDPANTACLEIDFVIGGTVALPQRPRGSHEVCAEGIDILRGVSAVEEIENRLQVPGADRLQAL